VVCIPSSEQIRPAPPEMRQWLEEELAASLGLRVHGVEELLSSGRVVAMDLEEAGQSWPPYEACCLS